MNLWVWIIVDIIGENLILPIDRQNIVWYNGYIEIKHKFSDKEIKMKIWLDDIRPMPQGFDIHCKTQNEAMLHLAKGYVVHISFDHDLGENAGNGYGVAQAIEYWAYYSVIPPLTWDVHSANPVGRRNIELAMNSAERYWNE